MRIRKYADVQMGIIYCNESLYVKRECGPFVKEEVVKQSPSCERDGLCCSLLNYLDRLCAVIGMYFPVV
jgi:hypothetical protein